MPLVVSLIGSLLGVRNQNWSGSNPTLIDSVGSLLGKISDNNSKSSGSKITGDKK